MQKWNMVFLLVGSMLFSANALTLSEKEQFVDSYRVRIGLLDDFPEKPEVILLCFDLNADGIDEIIATDNGSDHSYQDGNDWFAFFLSENQWVRVKDKMKNARAVDPISTIYNRDNDFHALKEENKPDRLIVIYTSYSKNGDGTSTETVSTSEITIDSEGYLLNTPMTNLTDILNDPLVPRQLVKLIPETFTEVPAYKPRPPESGISTNQTVVVEEVPVLKSGTTEK